MIEAYIELALVEFPHWGAGKVETRTRSYAGSRQGIQLDHLGCDRVEEI